jgi:hypothetical protein
VQRMGATLMHIRLVSIIVMWASIAHAMPFPVAPMGTLVDRVPRAGLIAWWRESGQVTEREAV